MGPNGRGGKKSLHEGEKRGDAATDRDQRREGARDAAWRALETRSALPESSILPPDRGGKSIAEPAKRALEFELR